MARAIAGLSIAALAALSAPALADPPANGTEAAQGEFDAGLKLYDAGQFSESLEHFQAAAAATDSPNARLYVARCLRELGRLDQAYDEMKATFRRAKELAQAQEKYAPTRDAAEEELALLERRVARIVISFDYAPEGVEIELNGRSVPREDIRKPLAVMPGPVVLTARAPANKPARIEGRVGAGEIRTLSIALEPEPATPPEVAPPPPSPAVEPAKPTPAAAESRVGRLRMAGFVSAGVGVVGLAVFAIAGSMSSSKFDTLETECGGKRCTDAKYADVVDDGKRLETIANVGLVVGAIGLVAGSGLIAFGGRKDSARQGPHLNVSPNRLELGYLSRF